MDAFTPSPTPYDITAMPGVLFTPGLEIWLILIGIITVSIFATYLLLGRKRSSSPTRAFDTVHRELTSLCAKDPSILVLDRVSNLLRTYLSVRLETTGIRIDGLTPNELRALAAQSSTPRALSHLLTCISEVETARFSEVITAQKSALADLLPAVLAFQSEVTISENVRMRTS